MKTLVLSLLLVGAASVAGATLTPDEQAFALTLPADDRTRYTATREYVHRAEAIVHTGVSPLTLGRKPTDLDISYYQGDDASLIDQARNASNFAIMKNLKFA